MSSNEPNSKAQKTNTNSCRLDPQSINQFICQHIQQYAK